MVCFSSAGTECNVTLCGTRCVECRVAAWSGTGVAEKADQRRDNRVTEDRGRASRREEGTAVFARERLRRVSVIEGRLLVVVLPTLLTPILRAAGAASALLGRCPCVPRR